MELGRKIRFFAPSIKRYEIGGFKNSPLSFVPVSITGASCQLRCEHCRGKILKSMYHMRCPEDLIEFGERIGRRGCRGMLISGGSLRNGVVPLHDFVNAMRELKERFAFKIAVHTGLVDEGLAKELGEANVDATMIDIIGCDETIKGIYHLDATVDDFERSLGLLSEHTRVAPHIVIGLHRGEIRGEMRALKMISSYEVSALVLVVISPLPGTPMEGVEPPAPSEIGEIFLEARKLFPRTPVLLGCIRPGGEHRVRTEYYALKAGLDGIAYPTEETVELSRKLGFAYEFYESCCSLIFR